MLYNKKKVSLQINISPSDYPSAKFILPHQLSALTDQVDETVLIIESKPSKGRFSFGWQENESKLKGLLNDLSQDYKMRVISVDYSEKAKEKIAKYFFGINHIPDKDFRGGPFYCYFFGLYHCKNDLVLHLDADIFLGGRSSTWITEAADIFAENNSVFCVCPLPGPPADDEKLIGQYIIHKFEDSSYKFQLGGFSTRIFLILKSLIHQKKLRLKKPRLKYQLKALISGNANADLPENFVSDFMSEHHLKRIDFLGKGKGLWSLHPPYRNAFFYENLPSIIKRVEKNDLPESQKGFYDIVDEVCDWNDVKIK